VAARVNFANDVASKFVAADSPQAATRIVTDCTKQHSEPAASRDSEPLWRVSQWSVETGGRMGQGDGRGRHRDRAGGEALHVGCTAQDQVQGKAVVSGSLPGAGRGALQAAVLFPGFVAP